MRLENLLAPVRIDLQFGGDQVCSSAAIRAAALAGQRIFAVAVATCGIDSQGQTFKITARDSDLPDLPE